MRPKFIFAFFLFVLMINTAHAGPSVGFFEISGGIGGTDTLDSPAVGVAGGFYITPGVGSPVALVFRPAFDWHRLDVGDDLFFSGNLELEFSAGDIISPSIWVGGGMNRFQGRGLTLAEWLATGISEGPLTILINSGRINPGDGSGAIVTAGCEVKIHLGEIFYVAPAFTFQRGFDDVASNNFQATLGAGAVF